MPEKQSPAKTKKSWKTTTAGIAGAVALLASQVQFLLDNDPATVVDYKAILAALAVFGIGWFSRDNGVSSEDAGAK